MKKIYLIVMLMFVINSYAEADNKTVPYHNIYLHFNEDIIDVSTPLGKKKAKDFILKMSDVLWSEIQNNENLTKKDIDPFTTPLIFFKEDLKQSFHPQYGFSLNLSSELDNKYVVNKLNSYLEVKKAWGQIHYTYNSSSETKFYKENEKVFYKLYGNSFRLLFVHSNTFMPLNDYYAVDDRLVFYKNNIIRGADPKTFTVVDFKYDEGDFYLSSPYAIDKKYIYYYDKKIKESDSTSRQYLDFNYIKDKNFVYYKGNRLEGVDVKTFRSLNYDFAKDKNNLYFQGDLFFIDGVDIASFKLLTSSVAKDKNRVYIDNSYNYINDFDITIDDIDTISFQYLEKMPEKVTGECCKLKMDYFKNNDGVYIKNQSDTSLLKINGADSETIIVFSNKYSKDKDNVYYSTDIIPEADFDTFTVINDYAKDKNHVYYQGIIVPYADVNSFNTDLKLFGTPFYAEDKNFYFYKTERFANFFEFERVAQNLESLGNKYFKDDKFIYYLDAIYFDNKDDFRDVFKIIDDADLNTFSIVDNLEQSLFKYPYYQDKNNFYQNGKKIASKEDNFEIINGEYTKKNNIVSIDLNDEILLIKNIDIKTFQFLTDYYSKDKNHVYYYDEIISDLDVDSLGVAIPASTYLKDKNGVYSIQRFENKKIELKGVADPLNFQSFGGGYAKDNENYYTILQYKTEIIDEGLVPLPIKNNQDLFLKPDEFKIKMTGYGDVYDHMSGNGHSATAYAIIENNTGHDLKGVYSSKFDIFVSESSCMIARDNKIDVPNNCVGKVYLGKNGGVSSGIIFRFETEEGYFSKYYETEEYPDSEVW